MPSESKPGAAVRYEDAVALRDQAAVPVVEQIREDIEHVDYPARLILERFAAELFSPELRPSKLIYEVKAAGTRSLEQFQIVTACTPAAYLEEARLEVALHLLTGEGLSIEAIAALVGFSSAVSFRRSLIRWAGVRPGQYRARMLELRRQGAVLPDPARMRRRWIVRLLEGRLERGAVAAMLDEWAQARGLRAAMARGLHRPPELTHLCSPELTHPRADRPAQSAAHTSPAEAPSA